MLFILACSDQKPIRIAAILPLTGAGQDVGENVRDGMQLAAQEINKKGGINARKIKLLTRDCKTNPDLARSEYKQMITQEPLLTVTCLSSVSTALAPIAEKEKELLLALVATAPNITQDRSWTYRYYPTAKDELPALQTILRRVKPRSLGIMYLDDEYGRSMFNVIKNSTSELDISTVNSPFSSLQPDLDNIPDKILNSKAVLMLGFPAHMLKILKMLDEHDYSGTIIANSSGTASLVRNAPAADGIYVVSSAIYNQNFTFVDKIRSRYEKRYKKDFDQYAANGYDFIKLLAGFLDKHGTTKPALKAAFEKGFVYSGIFGNVSLPEGSQDISFPHFPAQIENGQINFIR
jgi:branched-chain amino acid transport system substrate-binding protein